MAGNTKCYRVTIDAGGALNFAVVDFSPRFADSVSDAMMRLQTGGQLMPPNVRFHDRQELEQRWAHNTGANTTDAAGDA